MQQQMMQQRGAIPAQAAEAGAKRRQVLQQEVQQHMQNLERTQQSMLRHQEEQAMLEGAKRQFVLQQRNKIIAGTLAQQQANNPNRPETVLNEPDAPAPQMPTEAPVATGQEPQVTSAVDQSLLALQESIPEGAGAEMGAQTMAGGTDPAFGMPEPQQMFGPAGGIEAVEEARDVRAEPPDVNAPAVRARSASPFLDLPQPPPGEMSHSKKLEQLLSVPIGQKTDAQIEEQGNLAGMAEKWATDVVPDLDPGTPKESIELAKQKIESLMKRESFEEHLLRQSPEIIGTFQKERRRVRFSDEPPKVADRPVAVNPIIPTLLRPTGAKKKGGKTDTPPVAAAVPQFLRQNDPVALVNDPVAPEQTDVRLRQDAPPLAHAATERLMPIPERNRPIGPNPARALSPDAEPN